LEIRSQDFQNGNNKHAIFEYYYYKVRMVRSVLGNSAPRFSKWKRSIYSQAPVLGRLEQPSDPFGEELRTRRRHCGGGSTNNIPIIKSCAKYPSPVNEGYTKMVNVIWMMAGVI
jgi:hypothetical protein